MKTESKKSLDESRSSKVRFGVFEADLETEELRKSGVRIKIQNQPFKILSFMLERPGEVVSRDEMQQRLWGNQTTVDFDHSLGTAINKLREALGDSADNPRFIETLARRGYRFIAPVNFSEPQTVTSGENRLHPLYPTQRENFSGEAPEKPVAANLIVPTWFLSIFASLLFALATVFILGKFSVASAVMRPPAQITQITSSGRISPGVPDLESFPATAIDGSRIYYLKIQDGRAVLAQASITDGGTSLLAVPSEIVAPTIGDISPDGTRIIVRNHLSPEVEQALWIVPTLGGTGRKIPGVLAHDASWMPDGSHIIYATGTNLYISNQDGSESRQFASLPNRAFWLRWSPDGKILRFTLLDPLNHTTALWQISSNGKDLRPLLAGWSHSAAECCGNWTADAKYFVFQSQHGGADNIWALREKPSFFDRTASAPVEVTNGPLSYQAPITARQGHRIFFIGLDTRFELLKYDANSKQLNPYSRELNSGSRIEFSRDAKWVAWIDARDGSLWRSRADGSERLQLTSAPLQIFMMHWSPDDTQLALMAREAGLPWKIYLIPAAGGIAQQLLPENRNEADPDWSPDGRSIVFGRLPNLMAEPTKQKSIHILDLRTKQLMALPSSLGLFSPRWSPDGRYLAATTLDQQKLLLFDMSTKKWKVLASRSVDDPAWSHDGKWIYFHEFIEDGQPIYRVSVSDGRLEQVTGMGNLKSADVVDYSFSDLAPDDTPMVSARMWTANIYSLNLDDRFH